MSVKILIHDEELEKAVDLADQLAGSSGRGQMLGRIGEVLQETVRTHFELLAGDTAHHKSSDALGAERTGFYEEAANKVSSPQVEGDNSVSVSVDHQGLAQRFFGGDIRGDPLLTIPARAEAYGHRAREFENLQLVMLGPDHGMLIAKREGASLRGSGRGRVPAIDKLGSDVFYWLVRQVHQEPDPTVLPDEDEILNPALQAANDYLDILEERALSV